LRAHPPASSHGPRYRRTAAGTTNLIEAKKEEPKAAAPAVEAKKTEEAPVEAKKEEVKL